MSGRYVEVVDGTWVNVDRVVRIRAGVNGAGRAYLAVFYAEQWVDTFWFDDVIARDEVVEKLAGAGR